jgi:probable O-glycosylation ligase (exosortase A-associated)
VVSTLQYSGVGFAVAPGMTTTARPLAVPQPARERAAPAPSAAPGWDPLLICIAVYVAAAVGRIHDLFPVLVLFKPALTASVLVVSLYLLERSRVRRIQLLPSRTVISLIGLVLWAALTVPGALNQGTAFQAWTELARTVAMAFVVAASMRTARDVERVALVYFGVTVVYAAVVLSRFQLGADTWRLGRLYYYDANDMATLIVTAMPVGLYFVLGQRRLVVRAFALAGLAALAVCLIRSGSRGGLVAFLVVAAFVVLRVTTIPARSRLAGLVLILAVLCATASDEYWAQMQTIVHPKQDYNLTSEEGRLKVWKRGIDYMADNPVFGVGVNNFHVAEGTISPLARLAERGIGVRWGAAHNSYIQVLSELGIPGFLLFMGVLWTTFVSLRRVARRGRRVPTDDASRLAQSLMAALVGFVVGAFFLSLAYTDMLYMLVAISMGLAKTAHRDVV